MDIHPSQRRISCEACRKSKTKCQRLRVDDVKCIRCTLANADCDTGTQRKVGRPKRKAVAFSVPEDPSATKRKKISADSESHANLANEDSLVQHGTELSEIHLEFPEIHDAPSQDYVETKRVSDHQSATQPAVFAPISAMPDLAPGEWPTAVGDIWYDSALSQAVSSRICKRTVPVTRHDTNATAAMFNDNISLGPPGNINWVLSDFMDEVLSHNSRSWIKPDFAITSETTSNYSLAKKRKHSLPFGMGRPPAYYIHENQFSTNPADVSINISFKEPIVTLLSIVHGLRFRSNKVQAKRSQLDLSHLIQREGSLFIGTFSLVEYVMVSTEQLVHIGAHLLNTPDSTHRNNGKLSIPLVSIVMDVYCLILAFLELLLECLTHRAEHIATTPVKPVPGLRFDGVVIPGAGSQGTLICSSIFYLLGRAEDVLGLAGDGLFSASQIAMLERKLDTSDGLVQTKGVMRPADVKKLFMRVTNILEQLAATETV